MEEGTEALAPKDTFLYLLSMVCVLYVSQNYVVLATKQIYQVVNQNSGECIEMKLEIIRVLC